MWLDLQIFGFRALWSPFYGLSLILLGLWYYYITTVRGRRKVQVRDTSKKEAVYFYAGLVLLYIVKGSPIDLLSHIMLTAHMVQMGILYFVIPILFIRGIPKWLWESFLDSPGVKRVFRFFAHPLIALALFNSLFAIYHIPAIFDFSKSSQIAHVSITSGLFILAIFMWWPIVTPIKSYNRLAPLLKMIYLIVSLFIVSIACALIIFANEPLFSAYSSEGAWIQSLSLCVPANVLTGLAGSLSGAEMFSPLSTLEDQQLGGILMMTMQQAIYLFIIGRIFFQWFSGANMKVDQLPGAEK